MSFSTGRIARFRDMLASTNGGPLSQDIILAVLWRDCGAHLSDPYASIRSFVWGATRNTGITVKRMCLDGNYVLYQAK